MAVRAPWVPGFMGLKRIESECTKTGKCTGPCHASASPVSGSLQPIASKWTYTVCADLKAMTWQHN